MKKIFFKKGLTFLTILVLVGGSFVPLYRAQAVALPNPTTNPATSITTTDATLNGTNGFSSADGHSFWASLNTFSTASPVLTPGVTYSTPDLGPVTASTSFSALLSSTGIPVTPNTQYYFAAWALVGGTWYPGAVLNFTTASVVPACSGASSFDSFALGTVNGQDSWSVTGPYDQEIVTNTYGYTTFGCQSLRLSDSVTSGAFGDQTFAKPEVNGAGETSATVGAFSEGTRQSHFETQFDIASTMQTQQAGMHASVSPDRGDGSRMSYLRFEDSALGINVFFDDVQGATNPANFVETQIATDLSRLTPHTIKLTMDFLDGPSNDVVKVYIDGNLVHTGTSWENYYRFDSEASAEQSPRIVKTVLFRESGTATPANDGNGYLFDNFSTEASTPPPPTGSIVITKYSCPEGTTVVRSVNGVGGTVPAGCVLQSGKTFGYVHGTQADANGPYPELNEPLTAGGSTNGSGVLTISDLSSAGRYLVVETNESNQKIPDGDILGLYCIGDGDTSPNNDNQELTFVPANGTVNCVAYNKMPIVLTSIVTMCKQSDTDQPLSGWTLTLKGDNVEDLSVNSNAIGGQTTVNPLVAGASYVATAVGTWLNQGGANPVDAEYSTTDAWATQMDGYTGYQNDILELQIDNEFDPGSSWGAYNSLHTYAQSFIPSTTSANFRMFDGTLITPDAGWYGDNSGSLAVNIAKGFAGITGENGCVTFTGVPYGTYTAGEIMKDGWVHNSDTDDYGSVVVDGPTETFTIINHNNDVPPPPPTNGKVHIFKFINGVQATVESADGASFPMITPTYGNAPFTLDSDGWTDGDAPYEASTSTIEAGGTYTAFENTDTSLVGTNCEQEKPYELVGYSSGSTLGEAMGATQVETAPIVTVNGDKYIIVWNHKCGEVLGASTLKVHIYKYLDGETTAQVPNDSTAPSFPMTATWDAANIGAGTGEYVLGNNHGGTALKYAADTTAMEAPADYTTSEVTSTESNFLPIGAECVEGKYRLLGYKSSMTTLGDAENATLSTTAPSFTDLTADAHIIVVNEKCGDTPPPPPPPTECVANDAATYLSDDTTLVDGNPSSPVTPHEAWTASIPGATWIYSAPLNEAGSSPTGDKVFTKTFTITGTPVDSTLDIASDNMYTVSVNGTPLDTGTSATDLNNFSSPDTWTVLATSLVTGSNTLTITVTNPANNPENNEPFADPNPAGLLYKLTVNSKTCPPEQTTAQIHVIKHTVGGNGTFQFTDNQEDQFSLTTVEGVSPVGTFTVTPNEEGSSYNVNEINIPSGWDFTSVTCIYDGEETGTDIQNGETVTLDPGDEVTCTFTNTKEEVDEPENNTTTACSDGLDNDGDTIVDMNDQGCSSSSDNDELNTKTNGGSSGPTNTGGAVLGASIGPGPGQVLGASTTCGIYSDKFLRRGYINDPEAVKKLQKFLNENVDAGLVEDGVFGLTTENALKKFQLAHFDEILAPWGLKKATGIYYITTQRAVNNIMCAELKLPLPPLTPLDQNPLAPKKED